MNEQSVSILISLMGSLGDVTRGLTLIEPIKAKYPNSRITWLIEPKCLGIVQLAVGIDRIVLFKRGSGISAIIDLLRQLKLDSYDICLDLQRHFKSGLFSRLSGAKRIIGFHRQDSKEFNWLFTTETIAKMPEKMPKIEHYWQFLKKLGIEHANTARVRLNLIDKYSLQSDLRIKLDNPYLVINLGSAWESKDWPEERYFHLLKSLALERKNLNFILCGAATHTKIAARLEEKLSEYSDNIKNICAKTSLEQLISLIAYAELVFGPDSGPGHLAALLDVPFVGVFGPTETERTAPYGEKVRLLTADVKCRPCYKRKCPGLNGICMSMIEASSVKREIFSLIK